MLRRDWVCDSFHGLSRLRSRQRSWMHSFAGAACRHTAHVGAVRRRFLPLPSLPTPLPPYNLRICTDSQYGLALLRREDVEGDGVADPRGSLFRGSAGHGGDVSGVECVSEGGAGEERSFGEEAREEVAAFKIRGRRDQCVVVAGRDANRCLERVGHFVAGTIRTGLDVGAWKR